MTMRTCENTRLQKSILIHPVSGVLMKAYMCVICGFVYEEAKGHPESGVAPGTKWDDIPLNWRCPDCGAGKEDFEMIEI
jgi:rubredoxin